MHKLLLHKQLQIEGLLSPCACLACPRTEMKIASTEIKDESKEDIVSKLQVHTNELKLKEETDINEDEWIEEHSRGKETDHTAQCATKE